MTSPRQFELVERTTGALRLKLAGEGPPVETEVEGVVLEGQLTLDSGEFVVWSSEDCPYEETLHITLIGPTGAVLESRDLGQAMQPGVFGNLQRSADGIVEFDFFPGQRHRLQVRAARRGLLGVFGGRLKLSVRDRTTHDDQPT
jgi:hypothetical protein